MSDESKPDGDPSVDRARRKLLKLGIYLAPAVIGTLAVSEDAIAAASCGPLECRPPICEPRCKPISG